MRTLKHRMMRVSPTPPRDSNSFGAGRTLRVGLALLFGLLLGLPAASSSNGVSNPERGSGLPFAHRKLANVPFVVFDVETTGVNPKRDRVVELGVVKYQGGRIVAEESWLINPGRNIPSWAVQVHHINQAMVKDAPSFAAIYPEFAEFIRGSVLIAHNAPFDIAFVREELRRAGLVTPPNLVIDSLVLFRRWFPGLRSYALERMVLAMDIPHETFHRAWACCRYTALIFDKGTGKLDEDAKLSDVYADAGGALGF